MQPCRGTSDFGIKVTMRAFKSTCKCVPPLVDFQIVRTVRALWFDTIKCLPRLVAQDSAGTYHICLVPPHEHIVRVA